MASADKSVELQLLPEMSDFELLVAAEKMGTFDFLDAREEDGYDDLLRKHE
jgi:hypothetical protein